MTVNTLVAKHTFLPRFLQLSSVSVLSNMMVPLAGLVDAAFLGHLSELDQLGGVILGGILFDYLYRILKFLRSSTNALTAEAQGQEDAQSLLLALLRSGFVALTIGIGILLLQYPIGNFGFFLLSGSPSLEASGMSYFHARIWGAPAVLLNFVLIGWLLGQEKIRSVFFISLVGNGVNVLLDYWMIMRWGWGSMGAGLATALSQYSALIVGLTIAAFSIHWQSFPTAIKSLFVGESFTQTVTLKANILIRFLALISVYAIFTNLSAHLGSSFLTENGLLLQIAFLSQFAIQGVGMTTQTLIGNFKSRGETDQMMPLMQISVIISTTIALIVALSSIFFPGVIFSLLTSHGEVQTSMGDYVIWLLPLLIFTGLAFMLEGYFIGIKAGGVLRDSAIYGFAIGFLPLALCGVYFQNNHLLWAALTAYMVVLMVLLALRLPSAHQQILTPALEPENNNQTDRN